MNGGPVHVSNIALCGVPRKSSVIVMISGLFLTFLECSKIAFFDLAHIWRTRQKIRIMAHGNDGSPADGAAAVLSSCGLFRRGPEHDIRQALAGLLVGFCDNVAVYVRRGAGLGMAQSF